MTETTLIVELDMAYQGAMEKARDPNSPGDPEQDFEDAMLLKRARDRLAQYESQCIPRTADMPEWAFQWRKAKGVTVYIGWDRPRVRDEGCDVPWLQIVPAPDHCPDEPGPVFRHIVDVE